MLARNFLTADELGIPEEDRAALEDVLGMIERGELKYHEWQPGSAQNAMPVGDCFNMQTCGRVNTDMTRPDECGSVRCFGGWVYHLLGRGIPGANQLERETMEISYALYELYFPPVYFNYASITTEQASAALRNYLTTGRARWSEVLA